VGGKGFFTPYEAILTRNVSMTLLHLAS
jgi:hypothetical protein